MRDIEIDLRSGVPIYVQIVEQIQHQVVMGLLNPGDQLPTVRQLATQLRVNFNTVARAYRLLDETGLISTQQGRGTYIWSQPSEEAGRVQRGLTLEGLAVHFISEAGQLGFTAKEIQQVFEKELQLWQSGHLPVEEVEEK